MTGSVLERLRPPTRQPDQVWAARTLETIVGASSESRAASSTKAPALPDVGFAPTPQVGARRRAALVAAVITGLAATGIGVHLGLVAQPKTVLAEPAAPVQSDNSSPTFTDLGPLSATETRRLEQSCSPPGTDSLVGMKVHYARIASNGSSETPRHVAVVEDRRGEYRLCVSPAVTPGVPSTEQSGYGPGVLGPDGDLTPTRNRPLSLITAYQWQYQRRGDRFVDVHLAVAYATTSEVHRIEVRLSGAGADERWFSGTVHGGFAYIPLVVPELDAPGGTPDVVIESRGYDTDGQLITSDRQPYLNGNRDSRRDEPSFWR